MTLLTVSQIDRANEASRKRLCSSCEQEMHYHSCPEVLPSVVDRCTSTLIHWRCQCGSRVSPICERHSGKCCNSSFTANRCVDKFINLSRWQDILQRFALPLDVVNTAWMFVLAIRRITVEIRCISNDTFVLRKQAICRRLQFILAM
jgi:hypothetical protein